MTVLHLQRSISAWQRETFGEDKQSITGMWHHLAEELMEAANGDRADGEELADVVILAMGLADRQGLYIEELVVEKLMKLRKRKWLSPDENGVVRHVRDEEPPG